VILRSYLNRLRASEKLNHSPILLTAQEIANIFGNLEGILEMNSKFVIPHLLLSSSFLLLFPSFLIHSIKPGCADVTDLRFYGEIKELRSQNRLLSGLGARFRQYIPFFKQYTYDISIVEIMKVVQCLISRYRSLFGCCISVLVCT
jgi:hypothetical protein